MRKTPEIVALSCPDCGQKILVSNPTEGRLIACGCGAQLKLTRETSTHPQIIKREYSPQGQVIRVLTRYPYACEPIPPEATPDMVHRGIQKQIDAQGINATVDKVRIIKAKRFHYILPDIWTPSESPILPAIILGIFGVIKVALVVAGFIVGCWVAYEIAVPKPRPAYCPYCGEKFSDYRALQGHIRTMHPDMPAYVCPYCALPFSTPAELEAHMKECPEKAPPPIPWTPILIVGGIIGVAALASVVIPRYR